jgi:hypothetical protein
VVTLSWQEGHLFAYTGCVRGHAPLAFFGKCRFWGSGNAFLYDLDHGHYLSAVVDGGLFISDFFLLRTIINGVAKVGWRQLISPGMMRLVYGESWFGNKHAVWQIGDTVYHAIGAGRPGKWFLEVVKHEGTEAAQIIGEAIFNVRLPVLSTGLATTLTKDVSCVAAMLRALNRANYGGLERLFKAAVLKFNGIVVGD